MDEVDEVWDGGRIESKYRSTAIPGEGTVNNLDTSTAQTRARSPRVSWKPVGKSSESRGAIAMTIPSF